MNPIVTMTGEKLNVRVRLIEEVFLVDIVSPVMISNIGYATYIV